MERPKDFKLDHKSLCSSCNSYVAGEHQPWCETLRQKNHQKSTHDLSVYLALAPDLAVIERVSKRLFTEERLKNGDEYRDLAQQLESALRRIRDWPVSKQTADAVLAMSAAKEK